MDGKYKFSVLRTTLKQLSLTVSSKGVSFVGCNTNNLRYIASSDGLIKFEFVGKTKIGCPQDYDSLYV